VLNLKTNQIMETCEVTFDETQPCSYLVFDEEHEHGADEDGGVVPVLSMYLLLRLR
jgi:hypothetical protein